MCTTPPILHTINWCDVTPDCIAIACGFLAGILLKKRLVGPICQQSACIILKLRPVPADTLSNFVRRLEEVFIPGMLEEVREPHERYYCATMKLLELTQVEEVPDVVIDSWEIYEMNLSHNVFFRAMYVTLSDIFIEEYDESYV